MEAQARRTSAIPARPRPHEELLAVVDGDRLLLASAPLLELIGYTRSESAGPEFRAAYLFHPESSRAPLTSRVGPGPFEVTFAPPGAGLLCLRAFAQPIELPGAAHARALLFTKEESVDMDVLAERITRAVVASLRSMTADHLRRMRALDDALATLEDARPEDRWRAVPALLAGGAGYHAIDESIRGVERNVRPGSGFRGPYHRG